MLIKTGNNQPKGKEATLQSESKIVLINDSMQRLTLKLTDLKKETERFGYSSSAWLQLVGLYIHI